MKKVLILILALLMAVSMLACNQADPKETENKATTPGDPVTNNPTTTAPAQTETQAPVDLSNWGLEDMVSTDNGETIDRYIIRVPRYIGNYHRRCKISEQLDDTVVLLSGEYIDAPKAEKVSDVFSAYTQVTLKALETMYGVLAKNFALTIDGSEAVKIGDRDMYKHTGKITYDFDGAKREHQYVAYATKLEGSGNCAYWMVYDISEGQTNGQLIAEHALNMSKTFKEEK